jgi:signal transduction histidine kinase
MDLPWLRRALSLCLRPCASARYEARLFYGKVRRWLLGDHLWLPTTHPMSPELKAYGFVPWAVLILAILMLWVAGFAWYHLHCLRSDFTVAQSGSFHLAEHVPDKMLALSETLRGLGVPPNPVGIARFQSQAADMKLWLRTNRLSVTTAHQRELLGRIEAALDDYVATTTRLVQENPPGASSAPPNSVFERGEQEASPIPALTLELRTAEQAALVRFVEESRGSLRDLSYHVFVSVTVAIALGFAAFHLIQVARIAPLRAKLLQSHSIMEQQERLASLGTLAAGVAHEVRNPLTAIKVRLHSLKRATPGNASAADDLGVIQNEIKRLERFVGDFMQIASGSKPHIQTVAAVTLFEQLQRLLGPQLEAAGIRWQIEAPPEICVRADPQQLEQVLINLIQNAAENTPRGGSITLRAATSQARSPSGTTTGTVLEVADTGKGIPPEVAKRLFDPFFSTKERGTGLGLSVAAGIVHRHGGLIQYQTKVGQGTTFSIILPHTAASKHES